MASGSPESWRETLALAGPQVAMSSSQVVRFGLVHLCDPRGPLPEGGLGPGCRILEASLAGGELGQGQAGVEDEVSGFGKLDVGP